MRDDPEVPHLFRAGFLKTAFGCVGRGGVQTVTAVMPRTGANKKIPSITVGDPDEDDLGPAMLAIQVMERRWVIAYAMNGDATAAARSAGYSDKGDGAKVRGFELLRKQKVIDALREWTMGALRGRGVFVAVSTLIEIAEDKEAPTKDRVAASDSLCDRAGIGRQTFHQVNVEHSEAGTSTDDLVAALEAFAERRRAGKASPPLIEGEVIAQA